jgi:hypothetical protein
MKALMSVGALIGVVGLLLLVGMIFDVVPSNTVRLVEGYMPMQMLFELTLFVAGFTGLSYLLNSMGMGIPRFWQGIAFWAFILLYLKYRVYPPIPFSVRAMYGTVSLVAVFMWVSANEEDWKKFKQPILNVLDAQTGMNKMLRYAYLILLPIIIGGFSYNAMKPKSEEPIELRTVHPAPPASTKVHGKTYVLQTSQNPYRVNPEGKYDQEYTNANIVEQGMGRLMKPNANPWDPNAQGYLKYVREGGEILPWRQSERPGLARLCLQSHPCKLHRPGHDCPVAGDVHLLARGQGWNRVAQRRVSLGFCDAAVGAAFDRR